MTEKASYFIYPNILEDLKATTYKDALEEMVAFLVANKLLPSDLKSLTCHALLVREEKMTTAIGEHLAIPHASIPGLTGSLVMLAKSKKGIPCNALDNKPVHVFFLVLVPSHDYGAHLRTLARIGKFLSEPGRKKQLRDIENPRDIATLFEAS